MAVNLHTPANGRSPLQATPNAAQSFRNPTLSPKAKSVEATPLQASPHYVGQGPSRRSQLSNYPSYQGATATNGKMLTRYSVPGGSGTLPTSQSSEEVRMNPNLTARLAQPPPLASSTATTARRTHQSSGHQSNSSQKPSATGHSRGHDMKRSLSPPKQPETAGRWENTVSMRDKENRDDVMNCSERRSISMMEQEKHDRAELIEKDQCIDDLKRQIHDLKRQLQEKDEELRATRHSIDVKDRQILDMDALSRDKDRRLDELEAIIENKDRSGAEKDELVKQLKGEQRLQESAMQQLSAEKERIERRNTRLENSKPPEEEVLMRLKQQNQSQKETIENLQTELRRVTSAASLVSPGEFLRMAKSAEAKIQNTPSGENSELKKELRLRDKELELLCRRLPAEVYEAIACEAATCIAQEWLAMSA